MGTLLNMLEIHSWESAVIKADGLKIFLGVNPTFFAVNADQDRRRCHEGLPRNVFSFKRSLLGACHNLRDCSAVNQFPNLSQPRKAACHSEFVLG